MVMDARIAQLEEQMYRLRTDIEGLRTALWGLENRKQTDWFGRACLALIVITALLFGAFWHAFGRT
jgi:hypothetical protein